MFTLDQILEHVNGDGRAALRRLHALHQYHLKAIATEREYGNIAASDAHAVKTGHYRFLITQLEDTK
jgi:hypothetical protein